MAYTAQVDSEVEIEGWIVLFCFGMAVVVVVAVVVIVVGCGWWWWWLSCFTSLTCYWLAELFV